MKMKGISNVPRPKDRVLADTSGIIQEPKFRKLPLVDPAFYVSNNPRIKANLAQFHSIKPSEIRNRVRVDMQRQVESINKHIQSSALFKGITFKVDPNSDRTFATVRNLKTGKTIKQFPSNESLDRAARLRDLSGLLKDISI